MKEEYYEVLGGIYSKRKVIDWKLTIAQIVVGSILVIGSLYVTAYIQAYINSI